MINVLTAHTFELEHPEIAVSEILSQLDPDNTLRKNSVGIVSCHVDFLHSNIVKALSESLPFEILGMTTLTSAINGVMGVDILTISVLTSDEAVFSLALTTSLQKDQVGPVKVAYEQAVSRLPEKPAFLFAFGPLLYCLDAEKYISELNRLCEGVPIFGSLSCDHYIDYRQSSVFLNDKYFKDTLAILLVSGTEAPKFFYISISDKNVQKQKGIITSSTSNTIHTINDIPAMEYFESIGIEASNFGISGIIPMMVDNKDGTAPIGRGIYMSTSGESITCGGYVPEDGAIAPAFLDSDEVISSTSTMLEILKKEDLSNGMLIISCLTRSMVLGSEPMLEAERIETVLGKTNPYHLIYSGGEFCPVYKEDGTTGNRLHQFLFSACLF